MKTFSLSAAAGSLAATLLLLGSSVAPVAAQSAVANVSAIPSDVSSGCQTFLSTLNSDAQLNACTKPLLTATQYYASNSTDAASQLDPTLADLCSSNTGCDADIIRQRLDQFWQACHTDLQSANAVVQAMYDNLYMITPLINSICSKDDTNEYCLKTIAKAAASSSRTPSRRSVEDDEEEEEAPETVAQLDRRQSAATTGLYNETQSTGAANTNAAFLFISSTSPKSILCSKCSQQILASYIRFETSIPYAIGLRTSAILAPQSDIYKAAKTDCGLDFVAQVNKIANTTQFAAVVSGASFAGAGRGMAALATLAASAVVALVAL
ncbi:hypothetical protein PSEUBRA_002684 [Kalmanozyma brasiliensis GHG001]|uniref:DUF7729 domain-containing protein n=1 Tax=Kalmanozyma brasiliensis (strain GHG001) TaxID=1365824 RepID=V5GNS0_KALBG|nr:uncharacterized protein PSEUBRA_002684 [Kalmanozyma brasiliensis GHG001]EST07597.1 hypothetical protein PSEUBRA_002684 [Kalmanozyma brasiliensis GHG001]